MLSAVAPLKGWAMAWHILRCYPLTLQFIGGRLPPLTVAQHASLPLSPTSLTSAQPPPSTTCQTARQPAHRPDPATPTRPAPHPTAFIPQDRRWQHPALCSTPAGSTGSLLNCDPFCRTFHQPAL